jgi:MFS family permease
MNPRKTTLSNVNESSPSSTGKLPPLQGQKQPLAKAFVVAWGFALGFYFLEYAVRSSPSVMIPQLSSAFHTTAFKVSTIIGIYYYTYSVLSLVAGAALDHLGAKRTVPVGAVVLGLGCLLFGAPAVVAGDLGRLLQGAGSAFAFTGAVYLAVHGFSARFLATAIGATQCVGMLGGSAGQFVVGPLIAHGLNVRILWVGMGALCLANGVLLFLVTPRQQLGPHAKGGVLSLIKPFTIVFSNPQSYLCGIVAGLLFTPTTIGDMIWGVAILQKDVQFSYHSAVLAAAMVPLGWVIGCPLLGWLSDFIGRRKPVIIGGATLMAIVFAQMVFMPKFLPATIGLLIFGIASGTAMIPYSTMKEVNPDEVKGSATGAINFLVFGITALLGPIYAHLIGKTLTTASSHALHFRESGSFWIACCVAAVVVSLFLRETGRSVQPKLVHK